MAKQPKAPSHGVALTPAVWERICDRLMGGESLRAICEDAGMPSRQAVFKRIAADEEMRAAYEASRVIQADADADDIVWIADQVKTPDEAQVAKVKIAAREWRSSKLNPTKYGPKGNLEVGGGLVIEIVDPLADA
jgi:hypothetical protein